MFTIALQDMNGVYAAGTYDIHMKVSMTPEMIRNMYYLLTTCLLYPIHQNKTKETIKTSIQNCFNRLGEFFGEDAVVLFDGNVLHYGIDFCVNGMENWDIDICFGTNKNNITVENFDLTELEQNLI
jgi:hypothetical protein